ncbi:MAG: hypothetical protein EOM06_02930 [Sphingobacteriia bacterium]|nr:hypothetical protein [Sphingobacteriia bacterium]
MKKLSVRLTFHLIIMASMLMAISCSTSHRSTNRKKCDCPRWSMASQKQIVTNSSFFSYTVKTGF